MKFGNEEGSFLSSRKLLNHSNIGLLDQAVKVAHLEVGEKERPFPMRDHPAQPATQKIEPPADRLHALGVEAVEADEFLVTKFGGPVDLLATQAGPPLHAGTRM